MNEHLPQHEQVFLEREPTSQEIADVLLEIGTRNGLEIDLSIIEDISTMSLEEAIGTAYTLLLEWDLDPDEELASWGIIET